MTNGYGFFRIIALKEREAKMKRIFLITGLLTIFSVITFAQIRDSLIQLTESLGDTISYNEMQQLNILNLKDFKGFQQLVFYVRNDTTLAAVISYEDEAGNLKDSTLLYKASTLGNLRAGLRLTEMELAEKFEKQSAVVITDRNGINYRGVIESVSNDELQFVHRTTETYYNSIPIWKSRTFHRDEINTVFIEGESNVSSGMLYGSIIGFAAGAIVGAVSTPSSGYTLTNPAANALAGGIVVGAIGLLTGLVMGLASSSSDTIIQIDDAYDLYELNKYVMK